MRFRDLKTQYETLKPEIDEAMLSTVASAHYIGGEPVQKLEEVLADYIGVKHCITCGNGTDALTIALRCWEVGEGDAVFIPDFTFFSTGECPAMEDAHVVFVDVQKDTYNIDPIALEEAIVRIEKEGRFTPKVVIAVDLFGQPADYETIKRICREHQLYLLEDGAQGFGGAVDLTGNGDYKMACSYGDISTTSFFPAKPLGCYGDGGAIFTDHDEWAIRMRSIVVHGKDTANLDDPNAKYNNIRLGYNSRLDTIQAAILRVKLAAFRGESYLRKRIPQGAELLAVNTVADWYEECLRDYVISKDVAESGTLTMDEQTAKTGILLPTIKKGNLSSWAQYTVQLVGLDRGMIQAKLKEKGIPTMVYYPKPMHTQEAFSYLYLTASLEQSEMEHLYPVTMRLCQTVLSLPMHPYMTKEDVKMVAEALGELI